MSMTHLLTALLLLFPAVTLAQQADPVGRWKTIDDETGKAKSIVQISQAENGTLRGTVVDILQSEHGPNPVCRKCTGANKDKPIKGMTIVWDLKPAGTGQWDGGTILDPAKGKTYKSKIRLDGADKLGVSGCLAFICREQIWQRE